MFHACFVVIKVIIEVVIVITLQTFKYFVLPTKPVRDLELKPTPTSPASPPGHQGQEAQYHPMQTRTPKGYKTPQHLSASPDPDPREVEFVRNEWEDEVCMSTRNLGTELALALFLVFVEENTERVGLGSSVGREAGACFSGSGGFDGAFGAILGTGVLCR